MMVGMVTFGLIALGLPLVGWWLGGRSFVLRLICRDQARACASAVGCHGMTAEQQARIRSAVIRGRRLEDPRERAAAAAWAQSMIDQDDAFARRHPRWNAALLVALGLWGAMLVVVAVLIVVNGHHRDVPVFPLVWWLLFTVLTITYRRTIRRVVALNGDDAERRTPVSA